MVGEGDSNNDTKKNNDIILRLSKGILLLSILYFLCYSITIDNHEEVNAWEFLGVSKGVITYKKKIQNSNLLAFRGVTEIPYHISVSMVYIYQNYITIIIITIIIIRVHLLI